MSSGVLRKSNLRRPPQKLPITIALREVWEEDPHNYDHFMLWEACCTCYFGFLRSGEICSPSDEDYDPSTHLSFSDFAVDSHDKTSVIALIQKTKASKKGPFRQGSSHNLLRGNRHETLSSESVVGVHSD